MNPVQFSKELKRHSWRTPRFLRIFFLPAFLSLVLIPACLPATDLPHTDGDNCTNCHMVHKALGGAYLSVVTGNANLCQSCHVPGGSASAKALSNANQALPGPGLPASLSPAGNSHRWDSGVAGHIMYIGGAAVASTGTLTTSGTFTGKYSKTYTISITTSGSVGTARFDWTAITTGGGSGFGAGVVTGTSVALDQGIYANFQNGGATPFQAGDHWHVMVRTDLRTPTTQAMLTRTTNGQIMCSTCHNQHSQAAQPFDPSAPAYVTGSGQGRHYLIADNFDDQLCLDCHAARNVASSGSGSHPVGGSIPATSDYRPPSIHPLTSGSKVTCESCHDVHNAATSDGSLLRTADRRAACTDCHALADTSTPSVHLISGTSALWPGGQYGTTFPAITATNMRGACENCHNAHGWPDTTNPSTHYSKLLVDTEENLCFTCHDSDGPAGKNVKTDFAKSFHHPVSDLEQVAGRPVECNSCHNPHKALVGAHDYNATATLSRNSVSNPLKGADGVSVSYTGTNFQNIPTSAYNYISKSTGATYEYEVCFKCHSGYSFATAMSGTAVFTSGNATVSGIGTSWTASMVGSMIGTGSDTRSYTITAVTSGSTLTISPSAAVSVSGTYSFWNPPGGLTSYYSTGTANFTVGSNIVTGVGTTWNAGMVGSWIYGANNPTVPYRIVGFNSATSLTISPAYQ